MCAGKRDEVIKNGERGGFLVAAPGDRPPGRRWCWRRGDVIGCKTALLGCCGSSLSSIILLRTGEREESGSAVLFSDEVWWARSKWLLALVT